MRALFAPLLILLLTQPAVAGQNRSASTASQPVCPVSGDMRAEFASAVTASSFRTKDGQEIRLAGVIGPGEDGSPASPEILAAARSALSTALEAGDLRLAVVGIPDRYQRVAAQLFAGGMWVQQRMLRDGLVRVDPGRLGGTCSGPLFAAEHLAMDAHAGYWGNGRFRLRTPDEVTKSAGRFEIVDGEVWRSRDLKGRQIIDFRNASSFEVAVPSQAVQALRQIHVDLRRLRGKTIRVRGWIGLDDRPMMEISTPAALQIIQK